MNQSDFFVLVCKARGWLPTKWRIAVFNFWAWHETPRRTDGNTDLYDLAFNPLATTQPVRTEDYKQENRGFGLGNWNSVPVRMYRTPEIGAQATADTMSSDWYYHWVNQCFIDQKGYQEAVGGPGQGNERDFHSWVGSIAYGQDVVNFMNSCTESKTELFGSEEDEMTPAQAAALDALPYRLSCYAVASGDGDRMNYCYDLGVSAGLLPVEQIPPAPVPGTDVLNAYLIRRFNIIEAASGSAPKALYEAMAK